MKISVAKFFSKTVFKGSTNINGSGIYIEISKNNDNVAITWKK